MREHEQPQNVVRDPYSGVILWSGLLVPGIAWLLHFLAIWAIAEYGCVAAGFPRYWFLGVMDLAWAVFGATVVLLGICVMAGLLSHRHRRVLLEQPTRPTPDSDAEKLDSDRYMALGGMYSAFLFGLIIIVETIPIFFYLGSC